MCPPSEERHAVESDRWRRRVAARALPPVLLSGHGLIRRLLNAPLPRAGRHWAWQHVVNPYTIDPRTLRIARTAFGLHVVGTTRDFVFQHVWMFGVWEPNLTAYLSRTLRPGDTYVDVGGNIGYFALLGASLVGPAGRVVTLEPFPASLAALRRNLALNALENVRTVPVAASDRTGTADFYVENVADPGGASLQRNERVSQTRIEIATDTLANLLTDDELRAARVIKIDVEGAELPVVAGLAAAIDRLSPGVQLVVEVFPGSLEGLVALLAPLGFNAYLLPNPYTATHPGVDPSRPPIRLPSSVRSQSFSSGDAYVVFSRADRPTL